MTAIEDLQLFAKGWNIEVLSVKIIRESKLGWTHPRFLVEWLLDSDIHMILCQGIHCGMWGIWKPLDCVREILRLDTDIWSYPFLKNVPQKMHPLFTPKFCY